MDFIPDTNALEMSNLVAHNASSEHHNKMYDKMFNVANISLLSNRLMTRCSLCANTKSPEIKEEEKQLEHQRVPQNLHTLNN